MTNTVPPLIRALAFCDHTRNGNASKYMSKLDALVTRYDETPFSIDGACSTNPVMSALMWGNAEIYRIEDPDKLNNLVNNIDTGLEEDDLVSVVYYRLISGHVLEVYGYRDSTFEYFLFTAPQWETINEVAQILNDAIDLLVPSDSNP